MLIFDFISSVTTSVEQPHEAGMDDVLYLDTTLDSCGQTRSDRVVCALGASHKFNFMTSLDISPEIAGILSHCNVVPSTWETPATVLKIF